MAYWAESEDPNFPRFLNVNRPVGAGGRNRRDDVLLVQWLLRRAVRDNAGKPWAPPTPDLKVDGWIGPQTVSWIRSYQEAVAGRGQSCHRDGRVDRCPEDRTVSTVTQTVYTIAWLNVWLKAYAPQVFADVTSDPDLPPELRQALGSNDEDSNW